MADKVIEFLISADGHEVEIEGKGFVGKECEKAIEPYAEAFGVVTTRSHKREYSEVQEVNRVKQQ